MSFPLWVLQAVSDRCHHRGGQRTPSAVGRVAISDSTPEAVSAAARFCAQLAEGAIEANEELRARCGDAALRALPAPGLAVAELTWTSIANLGNQRLCGDGDVVAGVVTRFVGRTSGTAIAALEPSEALTLVRHLAPDAEPLEAFVALGRALGAELAAAVATVSGDGPDVGAGELDERPLASIVLGTHAPSDTAVLCARFAVVADEDSEAVSVFAYLLVDPKLGVGLAESVATA